MPAVAAKNMKRNGKDYTDCLIKAGKIPIGVRLNDNRELDPRVLFIKFNRPTQTTMMWSVNHLKKSQILTKVLGVSSSSSS